MNIITNREILEKFIYGNDDLERLEDISDKFNIFIALNLKDREASHSSILCWLMNPNESHGMGDYFLKVFIKKCSVIAGLLGIEAPSIIDIDSWDLSNSEVLKEWRNIDILIKCSSDNHKLVCCIENKIYSKEHGNQLQRYRDTILREFPAYTKLFVYLTIEGEHPSDQSEYIPFSYADVKLSIEQLLEKKTEKVSPEIVTLISHYKEMLGRYIVEDSEIQELCQKIYKTHRRALDLIFEYKPDKQLITRRIF
ncbi:PD-(D/E)XK nuclease family protein [Chloroflexota bacterium]